MSSNLEEIIRELITTGKEGDYWDFKAQHNNNAELIHDIICLANALHHKGDRYYILGIDDNCKLKGVRNHLKQADVIDTLRNSHFAGNVFPDVHLHDIEIEGKKLQVITIKDKPEDRPYYLIKNYTDQKRDSTKTVTVSAGAIYTRNRDTNTPKDQTASVSETEKMWRQKFGLDATPLERMTKYLLDFKGWGIPIKNFEGKDFVDYSLSVLLNHSGIVHYKQHPEFTIKKSPLYGYDEDGLGDKVDAGESWVRHAFDPISYMYKLELMYHQTVLHTEEVLTYDGSALFNNPRAYWTLKNFDGALFYYCLESDCLQFNILRFLHPDILDHTSAVVNSRRGGELPLVIFKDELELEQFCDYLVDYQFDISSIKSIEFYKDSGYDWENKPHDTLNIQLSLFVKEHLPKWRNKHDQIQT